MQNQIQRFKISKQTSESETPDIRVVNNRTMVEYEGRGFLGLTHSEKLNKMHMSTDINESEVVE